MRKNITLTLSVAAFTLLGLGCSCCCGGDKDGASGCCRQDKSCPEKAVKKAVTPNGEVVYIIAVWNADETCADGQKPCPTAQCWKTADGKTLCAKPVKDCPRDGKCDKKQCFRKPDGKLMAPETNAAAVVDKSGKKTFAVKEVKPCPKDGQCGAPSHVKMQDGKPGCAKADVKHSSEAKADLPAPMENSIMEEDYFIAFTD